MDNQRQGFLAQATQLVTLLAGIVGVVYIAGGLVVLGRLAFLGYARVATVAQLPREFLISIGLLVIVAPILVVGGGYLIGRASGRSKSPRSLKPWQRPLVAAVWGAIVLLLSLALADLSRAGFRGDRIDWFPLFMRGLFPRYWAGSAVRTLTVVDRRVLGGVGRR